MFDPLAKLLVFELERGAEKNQISTVKKGKVCKNIKTENCHFKTAFLLGSQHQ